MSETVVSNKLVSQVLGALLPNLIDADDDFSWGLKVRDILWNVSGSPNDPKLLWSNLNNRCDNKRAEVDQKNSCKSVSLKGLDFYSADVDGNDDYLATDKVEEGNGEPGGTFMGSTNVPPAKFKDVRNGCLNKPEKASMPVNFREEDNLCTDTEESEVDENVNRSTRSRRMPNESNYNALVAKEGPKEVNMCLAEEYTDTLQQSSKADGREVAEHVRTRLRLAAKLLGVRARQCKVAKKCPPVTFAFTREMERLTERSKLRRQMHEKSQHSEWLQETEVYDKLVSAVEQYQQLRTCTTKISPIEGKIQRSMLLNEVQDCFHNACCFLNGTIRGLRRFTPNSDIVRHWWTKASLLLHDSIWLKASIANRSSVSRVSLREEVFWLFSRLYFDSSCTERLTEYGPIDTYLQIDQLTQTTRSSLQLQMRRRPTDLSIPPKLIKVDTLESGPHEGTVSTNELFSHLSQLSYLEELKAKYENVLTQREPKAQSGGCSQQELYSQHEVVHQHGGESEPSSPLAEQKTSKSLIKITDPSTVPSVPLRASERSGLSSRSEKTEQREGTTNVLIHGADKDLFHERLDRLRHIYPHPYSIRYIKKLSFDEDYKSLLPTEKLLKSIILQLPHENVKDEVEDDKSTNDDDPVIPSSEMVRKTMRLSFSRFPFLLKTILRKNDVILEPRNEIIPRIIGINDIRRDSFDLSNVDQVIFRQQEPLQGLREGSEKYLLKCLLPEFIFNGYKRTLPEKSGSGYDTITVLMLPPDGTEASNILDLAGRVMDAYVPHIKEVFNSVFNAVRADFEWVVERDEEILGVGLTRLAHDLLRYRNTPGHCVRFKILAIIEAASNNSKLRNQLQVTAKTPNSWLDQTLRTFNSAYSSCRIEAAFIVAFMAKRRRLMRRFRLSANFETLLYDIAASLLRAADMFEEDFCEIFLALSYLFHFIHHRALLAAVMDRYSTFRSVRMTSAWPLLIVYAFRFWSTIMVNDMNISRKRVIAALHSALCNPLSRQNARMAVDAVESATPLRTDILTRWPKTSQTPEEATPLE
ncbi:unnamed protein product [Taenia asiatica]|uniref:RUN domain-containing protein n=1 Tax=Taenia asiatica TaxID=60517 RepID=A0A0R3VTQ6_TAEAS|nr:unnamed protein product [Taenia asiatica]